MFTLCCVNAACSHLDSKAKPTAALFLSIPDSTFEADCRIDVSRFQMFAVSF